MYWDNMINIDVLKEAALIAASSNPDLVESMQAYPGNVTILVGPMDKETELKVLTGNILKDDEFLGFYGFEIETKEQFLNADGEILVGKYYDFLKKWFLGVEGAIISYEITKTEEGEDIMLFVEF